MPQHRQLSAIMFTDIEGYTAMMQRSEQEAIVIRNRHREIMQEEHEQSNGRIIQFYGDGSLSTFQSVIEAVQCALSMQLKFLEIAEGSGENGYYISGILFLTRNIFSVTA